jgi:hypothetical protein
VALTERNRNALYQGLTRTIGDEEAVEAMLAQFPAHDLDEPATKDFVMAVEARVERRIAEGDADTNVRMAETFAEFDARMTKGFAELKEYVHAEMRHWFLWSYGAMFVLLAAVVTAAKILE